MSRQTIRSSRAGLTWLAIVMMTISPALAGGRLLGGRCGVLGPELISECGDCWGGTATNANESGDCSPCGIRAESGRFLHRLGSCGAPDCPTITCEPIACCSSPCPEPECQVPDCPVCACAVEDTTAECAPADCSVAECPVLPCGQPECTTCESVAQGPDCECNAVQTDCLNDGRCFVESDRPMDAVSTPVPSSDKEVGTDSVPHPAPSESVGADDATFPEKSPEPKPAPALGTTTSGSDVPAEAASGTSGNLTTDDEVADTNADAADVSGLDESEDGASDTLDDADDFLSDTAPPSTDAADGLPDDTMNVEAADLDGFEDDFANGLDGADPLGDDPLDSDMIDGAPNDGGLLDGGPAEDTGPTEGDALGDDFFDDLDTSSPAPPDGDSPLDDVFSEGSSPSTRSLVRTWVDNTGLYRVEARLVKIAPNFVQLLKANGRTCTVPLRRLSMADFERVQSIASEQGLAPLTRLASR